MSTASRSRSADFKGSYVVLEWNNPNCPFVQKHYSSGNMQTLQKRFVADNVAWLSSQFDERAPTLTTCRRIKLVGMVQAAERGADRGPDGH